MFEDCNWLIVEGWHSWLNGEGFEHPPKEIFFCSSSEEETKSLIKEFEEKYKRKLQYRVDGLTYISYK